MAADVEGWGSGEQYFIIIYIDRYQTNWLEQNNSQEWCTVRNALYLPTTGPDPLKRRRLSLLPHSFTLASSVSISSSTLIAIVAAAATTCTLVSFDRAYVFYAAMARRSGDCMKCLVIFAVVSALVVCGPALYWKFNKGFAGSTRKTSVCPPCLCDCPPPVSLLELAPGITTIFSLSLSLSFSFLVWI